MVCGGIRYIEVQLYSFLTLALDGGECSTVHHSCGIAGETVLDTRKAECTLELIWTILEKKKSLASARNQTVSHVADSLLAV